MKLLVAAMLVLLLPSIAQAGEGEDDALRFMKSWVDSFNANDATKISGFYEVDDRVQLLASNGLSLTGHDAIAQSYERDMKAVRFYDSKSPTMSVRVFDDTALASFVHRFKYEILASGQHCAVHIRTTTTLRQTDSGWRIVMEHSSPIQGVERVKFIDPE